jgi:predicted secreted protein
MHLTFATILFFAQHHAGYSIAALISLAGLLAFKLSALLFGVTPAAQPAINTFLQLGNGASPEVFTTVANVSSITGPGLSLNVVDVTSHSTAVPWRQKIGILLDQGDLTFDCYFIPNDAGHQALMAQFVTRNTTDWQLSFPTTPTRTVWGLHGFISKFSMSEPVDNVVKAQLTITGTGIPAIPGATE